MIPPASFHLLLNKTDMKKNVEIPSVSRIISRSGLKFRAEENKTKQKHLSKVINC